MLMGLRRIMPLLTIWYALSALFKKLKSLWFYCRELLIGYRYLQWLQISSYLLSDIFKRYRKTIAVGLSADMFESVNKKTLVHPLFKVGLSLLKRLPEEARLNSDGWSCWYTQAGYRKTCFRRGASSVYNREFKIPIAETRVLLSAVTPLQGNW